MHAVCIRPKVQPNIGPIKTQIWKPYVTARLSNEINASNEVTGSVKPMRIKTTDQSTIEVELPWTFENVRTHTPS